MNGARLRVAPRWLGTGKSRSFVSGQYCSVGPTVASTFRNMFPCSGTMATDTLSSKEILYGQECAFVANCDSFPTQNQREVCRDMKVEIWKAAQSPAASQLGFGPVFRSLQLLWNETHKVPIRQAIKFDQLHTRADGVLRLCSAAKKVCFVRDLFWPLNRFLRMLR